MTWQELKKHDITIYSTPWCGDCRSFKKTLAENGLEITEINIEEDPKAADYLVEQTGHRAIPYAEINGNFMVRGWHKEASGRWDDATFLKEVEEGLQEA